MSRARRIGLGLLAVAVLLPVAAVAAFTVLVDSDAVKTRAADAVRRATGRELVIAGPIGLTWSLAPTIALRDVSLSNPPGMSRPAMAQARQIEAQIALLPLLSRQIDIRSVTLVEPDILLERDAAGRPNWLFTPDPAPVPTAPAADTDPRRPMAVSIGAVSIRDARVGWGAIAARLPTLTLDGAGAGGPVAVSGTIALRGTGFEVRGTTGPLAAAGSAGWPVQVTLIGGGLRAAADGTLGAMALSASIADLSTLGTALGQALPPLQGIEASAQLTAAGLGAIDVRAGPTDLAAYSPGFRLVRAQLLAPAAGAPVTLRAEALAGSTPVAFAANTGSLASVLGAGPVAFQVRLLAAGADLAGEGTVADLTGRGLDAGIVARVPDLAALGTLAGVALPPVRDVAFDARASLTAAGGLALRAMRLVTPQGDVGGDVVLGRTPRLSIRGTLISQRLDVDAWPRAVAAAAAPQLAAPPATPPPTPSPPAPWLSDAPLPFETLRRADADLQIAVNEAVWRSTSYRAINGRLMLQDGRLRIDPVQAQGPGGPLQMLILADAAVPSLGFGLRAPGLAAGPLLMAFGAPDGTAGLIDADLQLKGEGASPRAIAATLDGYIGFAMVEGQLDNRWLTGLLGNALRSIPVDMGGRSMVRCLALRLDIADGQAAARALLLDATRLRLEGEGGFNLVDETLDLRLRTLVRLGATSVAVPVHLTGPWRSPRPQVAGPGGALVIGAPPGPDACPAQLTLARNGRPGPPPSAIEAPPAPRGVDILRQLLR